TFSDFMKRSSRRLCESKLHPASYANSCTDRSMRSGCTSQPEQRHSLLPRSCLPCPLGLPDATLEFCARRREQTEPPTQLCWLPQNSAACRAFSNWEALRRSRRWRTAHELCRKPTRYSDREIPG